VTRVVTTNDLSQYLQRGDRFVMLCEGRLVELGTSAEALNCTDDRVRELLACEASGTAPARPGRGDL